MEIEARQLPHCHSEYRPSSPPPGQFLWLGEGRGYLQVQGQHAPGYRPSAPPGHDRGLLRSESGRLFPTYSQVPWIKKDCRRHRIALRIVGYQSESCKTTIVEGEGIRNRETGTMSDPIDRRRFLAISSVTGLTAGLAGPTEDAASAPPAAEKPRRSQRAIPD